MAPNEPVYFKPKRKEVAEPPRVAPTNQAVYGKKEFEQWYGGLDEWHAAPEQGQPDVLMNLLRKGKRAQGHDFLLARGVDDEEHREIIMDKHVPEKARPKKPVAHNPVPDQERYPRASAAIAAGKVAFVTVADGQSVPFVANCLHSLDRCLLDEVKLVGQALPLTIYATDAGTAARLTTEAPTPLSPEAAHVVLLDGAEDLLEEARALAPAERLQWFKLAVIRRALDTHEVVVFVDASTVFERAGCVPRALEPLLASAAEAAEASDHAAEEATAAAPRHPRGARRPEQPARQGSLPARGLELMMQSDGLAWDLTDATLGLTWTRLPSKPQHPGAYGLVNKGLAKILASGKTTFSREEVDGYEMADLSLDCYIEAGTGSTLTWFMPTGYGASTAVMAVRATPGTKQLFDVDVTSVRPGWSEQRHVQAGMYGRVHHGVLPISNFPNAQYWTANRLKFQEPNRPILPSTRPYLVSFARLANATEIRSYMEADGRWFVGRVWDADDDGEDEELIIV